MEDATGPETILRTTQKSKQQQQKQMANDFDCLRNSEKTDELHSIGDSKTHIKTQTNRPVTETVPESEQNENTQNGLQRELQNKKSEMG